MKKKKPLFERYLHSCVSDYSQIHAHEQYLARKRGFMSSHDLLIGDKIKTALYWFKDERQAQKILVDKYKNSLPRIHRRELRLPLKDTVYYGKTGEKFSLTKREI